MRSVKRHTGFRLFGIFGYPLEHTLSPHMHEAGFRALGIDANYIVLEQDAAGFREAMRGLRRSLLSGFNVTVPYKETVLKYLDGISREAREIGAVNTVYQKGTRWFGANTDMEGFLLSLGREGKYRPEGKRAVILGAGGASRAVVYGLSRKKARAVTVVDMFPEKAEKIARDLGRVFRGTAYEALRAGDLRIRELIGKADLVVNATPLGLKKTDPMAVPSEWIPKADAGPKLFMDLIYNPAETRFLALARKRGHRTLNGLGMLFYQGVRAFECWTGGKAPVSVMRNALLEALRTKGKP